MYLEFIVKQYKIHLFCKTSIVGFVIRAFRMLYFSGILTGNERTPEDVENAYLRGGVSSFAELNGMFIFVIDETDKFVLVRDHHGQKSLYFTQSQNGEVRFSECLEELATGKEEIDLQALRDYLSLGYIPAPRTIFRGIFKVPPATAAIVQKSGGVSFERYWNPIFDADNSISFKDAVHHTRELIEKSIERFLNMHPDAGVLLSGGIDSNVMLGLTSKIKGEAPDAFTIGFSNSVYDESSLAAISANRACACHFTRISEFGDMDIMKELLPRNSEPFADSSLMPSALAMRLAASHCSAVICGDGGDELFGGYQRYQVMLLRQLIGEAMAKAIGKASMMVLSLLPYSNERRNKLTSLRRLAKALSLSPVPCYASFQELFDDSSIEIMAPEVAASTRSYLDGWQEVFDSHNACSQAQNSNLIDLLSYMPDDCCRKGEIASRGLQLVAFSPMLDMEVTNFALSIPFDYKCTLRERKRILRSIGSEFMAPELLHQGKRGFGMPISDWITRLLSEHSIAEKWNCHFIDRAFVSRLEQQHLNGIVDNGSKLWSLFQLTNAIDD